MRAGHRLVAAVVSVEHLAAVLHHSKSAGTRKLVLLGIANHQGDGGAWPSVEKLSKYANVSERNVQKAIAWLVSKGELRVELQQGGNPGTPDHARPNRYEVLVECPPWCDRTPHHRDTRKWSGRQPALWTDRVSHPTPGVTSDRGGVSHPTPGGVSHPTPKPSREPTSVQVDTEVLDTRACTECSQPERLCRDRQLKLRADDRHTYSPVVHHASG